MATVTADLSEGFQVEIRSDGHLVLADEPADVGGSDTGPSPYELLLGALGACTAITLRMIADAEDIALDHISTRYTFDRVHASDCLTCDDDATGFIDRVTSQIFLDGDFTDEQRRRLTDVARRCPVHKTLAKGIHFEEEVVVG